MRKLIWLVGVGFLNLTVVRAQEAALQPAGAADALMQGQRIYAAHHSYFIGVADLLTELAAAGGVKDHVILGAKYIGGSKSLQHWNLREGENKARETLLAGSADVLVLTPVYLPDEGIEKFAALGVEHNPQLRVTVMEFWLPYDAYEPHYYDPPIIPHPARVDHNAATANGLRTMHEPYFKEMDAEIQRVNQKLGKQVVLAVPVGQAILALREKIIAGTVPGLKSQEDLFTDALGHPKPVLQVLLAYSHYAVIYRQTPVGLAAPKALLALKLAPEVAAGLNHLLQELAWNAVIQHPLSGVAGAK